MKFKNSYILLIAIAVLLISIGSVCASDNATSDSDDVLAEQTEVVLADGDDTGEDTTEQINTTITATGDEKFAYDSDKNITVSVKDNESQEITVNESNLTVFEGNTSINFTYNNSKITILDNLSVGNHTLLINYLGNANYTNASTEFLLKIYGNSTLQTPESVVSNGTTVTISDVYVFDGVENIELTKDGFTLNLTYTNSTGNVTSVLITDFTYSNGTISFENNIKWISASIALNYTDAVNTKTVRIYLNSTVEASDAKIRDTQDKNITVSVVDSEGNALNVTKSMLQVLENGKDVAFTLNNSVITITSLAIGEHNLTIVYKGNDTYVSSNKTVTVKVWGNQTMSPDSIATVAEDGSVNITINLSDGVDPVDVNLTNLNITVFWSVGNQTYNKTITSDNITLEDNNQTVTFKFTDSFDSAYANISYAALEGNLTAETTLKVYTQINSADVISKTDVDVLNFTVTVTAGNGALNVTGDNLKVYNGSTLLNTTYSNSTITITDKLTYGNYNLTIKFTGNDTYSDATKDIVLKVLGIAVNTTSVNVNSSKKGEAKFNVTDGVDCVNITADNISVTVSYKDGNNTVNVNVTSYSIVNGTLYFELAEANFTTATMTVTYNNASTANITLNRIYNIVITPVNVVADYQEGNFTFLVTDLDDNSIIANKTLTLSLSKNGTTCYFITKNSSGSYNLQTSTTLTTDENGIITLVNKGFYPGLVLSDDIFAPIGTYEVTVTGSGALKGTNKTNITISKINVTVTIDKYEEYYGSSKNLTIKVTNSNSGNPISGIILRLYFPQITSSYFYVSTNSSGVGHISVSGVTGGTYDVSASINDTSNVENASANSTMTIKKIPVVISGKNVNIYFNTGTTYSFTVTKDGKGVSGVYVLVRLYTTSKKYNDYLFQTNSKGKVSFSASLAVGKHKVIVALADTRYSGSQITKTITVKKATAKIKAKKVKTYYKAGKYFTVKVINKKNKKAIYDAKVNIKIYVSKNRYYNYNGNTGSNGKLKLLLDSLKPGSYKVEVSGASSKNYTAKTVTSKIVIKKAPTKLIAKKVKVKKGAKKYFKVTAKNKKTKKVISKIKLKVKVYTGKKSKTYTVKTNSKGVAKLSTAKLKAGKHKVVVSSANKYCKAKKTKSLITVKK